MGNPTNMTLRILSTRLLALVVAFAVVFTGPVALAQESPSPAETADGSAGGNGGDNLALAVNTKDGSSVVKFAFEVRRVMNGVVDQTNAAVAFASCENCRTVAVAIQIVMVMNDPNVVTPTNIAIAYNYQCTTCETLASAYQFVFSTGGLVRFTKEGWEALVDIRKEIRDLLKDDSLPIATLQAELDALMDQVRVIIANELQPIGPDDDDDEQEASPAPEATGSPDPGSTPAEGSSTSPSPAATEEEPSPSPSQ